MILPTGLRKTAFLGAYLYSGTACILGSFACLFLFIVPMSMRARERITRRIIHYLCAGLVAYLRFFKLLKVDFGGLHQLRQRRGVIIAANHPTYIDAILMMSQLPDVFCLMKARLHRNPLIAVLVRSAGYEDNADANQLVENCAGRLRRGENLLVFPEGTRTTTPPVGRLKRGFALMAMRAAAPILTVLAAASNGPYLRKGQPFFAFPPSFPIEYHFSASAEFPSLPGEESRELCLKVEAHFRQALAALD